MRLQRLNELSKSEHRVIVGALLFIGALALHNWLVSPHVASLRASQRYERAASQVKDKSQAIERDLQDNRKKLERLLAERAVLAETLFESAEAELFFNGLEPLCVETHCTILSFSHADDAQSVRPGGRDGESPAVQKTASVTLRGAYMDVLQFVDRLVASRRKVWIDSLKITSAQGDHGVTCQLAISIYVRRDKENDGYE